jgi:hypothetical protein
MLHPEVSDEVAIHYIYIYERETERGAHAFAAQCACARVSECARARPFSHANQHE